jgi:hypothetical protein
MPTRFAKMLGQIVRGGLSVGMAPDDALAVAVRIAGDSITPPIRRIEDHTCGRCRRYAPRAPLMPIVIRQDSGS